jgi:tyrosine-protein kinase Etk/Wzc
VPDPIPAGEEPNRPPANASEEAVDVLDLLIVLAKHKKLVLGVPFLVALATAAITLFLPNIYTGTAMVLPPQQQQSAGMALLGQLNPSLNLAASTLGLKNPAELYIGMLRSRSVAENIIERFRLKELYRNDTLVDTRKDLDKVTEITAGKDGIIVISVEDEDPKRAAEMANAYVHELDRIVQSLALTEAAQRRVHFERQIEIAKQDLAQAEMELSKTQEASGLIQLEDQAKALLTALATLQAQVMGKEGELAALRVFSTPQNPDYMRAQQQLAGLRKELSDMQRKSSATVRGDVIMPIGNIPQAGLDYVRKLRDVKYQEALFEFLAKQLEMARIDEAKDATIVQVIDRGVPADKKSKPRRALITIVVSFLSLIIVGLFAVFRELQENATRYPAYVAKLAKLRSYLRFR